MHSLSARQPLPAGSVVLLRPLVWILAAVDTSVHFRNHDVLATFETARWRIDLVLSDNDQELYGRPNRHTYELFLQLKQIDHRTKNVNQPRPNGIVRRFHRTLLAERFRVEGRCTWFETIDEMQGVLDNFLVTYNPKCAQQGRGMNGYTPWQAFKEYLSSQNHHPQLTGGMKGRMVAPTGTPPRGDRGRRLASPYILFVLCTLRTNQLVTA